MEGRFSTWCLLIAATLGVFVGYSLFLDQFDLNGWQRFLALVPLLLVIRFVVQRFLAKGRRKPPE